MGAGIHRRVWHRWPWHHVGPRSLPPTRRSAGVPLQTCSAVIGNSLASALNRPRRPLPHFVIDSPSHSGTSSGCVTSKIPSLSVQCVLHPPGLSSHTLPVFLSLSFPSPCIVEREIKSAYLSGIILIALFASCPVSCQDYPVWIC